MKLPAIPTPGAMISPDAIVALEIEVSRALATIDDVDVLQEWRARAAALEAYLRGKDLNGPMLGAQRRVEARIGQLLGDADEVQRAGKPSSGLSKVIKEHDRYRFRILARGLDRGLTDDDWRQAREPLLALIQLRFPMPRHIPTIVQSDGKVKKPRAERGMRAAQIAADIGIDDAELPELTVADRSDLMQALARSINGLKKLRTKMERAYAGHDASAA